MRRVVRRYKHAVHDVLIPDISNKKVIMLLLRSELHLFAKLHH